MGHWVPLREGTSRRGKCAVYKYAVYKVARRNFITGASSRAFSVVKTIIFFEAVLFWGSKSETLVKFSGSLEH